MQAQEVSWRQSLCGPWTWTAEELTLEAGLPFSLVSWLIHSLGFPKCCRTVCTGVLPLAVCSGGGARSSERKFNYIPAWCRSLCVSGHPALAVQFLPEAG